MNKSDISNIPLELVAKISNAVNSGDISPINDYVRDALAQYTKMPEYRFSSESTSQPNDLLQDVLRKFFSQYINQYINFIPERQADEVKESSENRKTSYESRKKSHSQNIIDIQPRVVEAPDSVTIQAKIPYGVNENDIKVIINADHAIIKLGSSRVEQIVRLPAQVRKEFSSLDVIDNILHVKVLKK